MGQRPADWVPHGAWLAPGYAEWAPPAALGGFVSCLWASVADASAADGADSSTLVLPDACSDLIWEQGTGSYVAGPDSGPFRTQTQPGMVIVGVRFRPAAGGQALGLPLSELLDQRVPLADLLPAAARRIPATLSPQEAATRVLDIAGQMIAGRLEPDSAMTRAAVLLRDPAARTEDVAGQVGLSERQLRRRCHSAAGYGPKTLQRVLRFQRFVRLLDAAPLGTNAPGTPESDAMGHSTTGHSTTGHVTTGLGTTGLGTTGLGARGRSLDLAAAAAATGYADQPHLTRECVALSGLTPAELTRLRRPAWSPGQLAVEAA